MTDTTSTTSTTDHDSSAGEVFAAFMELHRGLPRQSPGSDTTTRHLLSLCGPLPERPRVLDIGCGPGPGALLLAAVSALITLVASSAPAAALADPQPGRLRVHAPDDPQPRRLQRHTTEEITSFLRAFYGNHGPSEQDRVNRVSQLLKDKQAHFPETDVLLCRPGTPQSITVGQATAAPSAFVGWATVTTTWPSGVTDTFTAYVRTDSRPITLDDVICAG